MSAVDVTVTVRIQSETLTIGQISTPLGAEPTHATRTGDPASSRNPADSMRAVTTWELSVREYAEDPMTPAFDRLRPVLVRLAGMEAADQTREVLLTLHGREMGNWYTIEPEFVGLIAEAGAGLIIDAYSSAPDDDETTS